MQTGTVKFFNPTKGYGFIVSSNGGPDCFLHARELERAGITTLLNPGDRVIFTTRPDKFRADRVVAVDVKLAA